MIDFHVHLPWRLELREAAEALRAEMRRAGVRLAVAINVEAGLRTFKENVSQERVLQALGEALEYSFSSRAGYIVNMLLEPERAIWEHLRVLAEVSRDSVEFVRFLSGHRDIVPVASYNPDLSPGENLRRLKALGDLTFGLKVFPTLHFTDPDKPSLLALYEEVGSVGGVVIVHTGCDPGIWELPSFCSGRPSSVARAARKVRGTTFVVAHLGSYSALSPGIYFREALEALAQDNVYADTSAAEPEFVEKAVREVGYEKILFGSDYPAVEGLTIEAAVREVASLDLSERAKRAIFEENALRLLKAWSGWRRLSA
ncbi:MAG: amidohydrolase family protein [Acidilobaceae archaeon]|nr:amidohydrolase family protein [Acidilobaceae archaeon]